MSSNKVFVLQEPSILSHSWLSHSIEGLKHSAARQKKLYQEIDRLEDIDEDYTAAAIIVGTTNEWIHAQIDQCRQLRIRPILIGSNPIKFGEDVSGTRYSGKSSVEGLMRYYVSCGRKRIALLGINEMASNDIVKRDIFLAFANQYNLPITPDDIYYKVTNSGNPDEAFFDAIHRYDGVICGNDYVAAFVLQYASKHGIRVPEDLFVSGFGDNPLCRYTKPSLTSATRAFSKTGEQAFSIWKQLSCDPDLFSIIVTVQCEIKTRGSTGFAPMPPVEISLLERKPSHSLPPNAMAQEDAAIRSLEQCLTQCDKTDIRIIYGLLHNETVEAMADEFYVSPSTVRYRIKKICEKANVSTRSKFLALFNRYICSDTFFAEYLK